MKLKKANLEVFFTVLRGTDGLLSLKDARIRDAFMKELSSHYETFYTDRRKVYEKFCKKNEDGSIDDPDGRFHFESDVVPKVNQEVEELLVEEVELTFPWGVTGEKLKEIIEKSDYKPKYGEAELIDDIISKL